MPHKVRLIMFRHRTDENARWQAWPEQSETDGVVESRHTFSAPRSLEERIEQDRIGYPLYEFKIVNLLEMPDDATL